MLSRPAGDIRRARRRKLLAVSGVEKWLGVAGEPGGDEGGELGLSSVCVPVHVRKRVDQDVDP